MNPTVFLVETPYKDVSRINTYGEPAMLWPAGISRPSIWDTERVTASALARLETMGYNPDVDYLALVGSNALVSIVLAAVCSHYGQIGVVMFDNKNQKYIARRLGVPREQPITNSARS